MHILLMNNEVLKVADSRNLCILKRRKKEKKNNYS